MHINRLQLTVNNGGTATSINYLTNLLTTDTLCFLCWVITPTSWTLYVNGDKQFIQQELYFLQI